MIIIIIIEWPYTHKSMSIYLFLSIYSCLVTQSCPILCNPMYCSEPGLLSLTISKNLPKFMFIVMPSSHLILWHPLLLCPWVFPASGTFLMSCLFTSDDQNTGASAWTSILPVNIQGWSPSRLVWSSCCPRDFQESSPASQFEGINSYTFYLLYSQALTILRDHWEDHSLYGLYEPFLAE